MSKTKQIKHFSQQSRELGRERHGETHPTQEIHPAGHINPNEPRLQAKDYEAAPQTPGTTVYLNSKAYHIPSTTFTGADLRKLSAPPIGPEENIFRVVSGKNDDIQLNDAEEIIVKMHEANLGRHFFSDTIVPSKDAVARRAYFLYLETGKKPGHDLENWSKAESQLKAHTKHEVVK